MNTNADDTLAIFDIDDYDDLEDKSGLSALAKLEPTLEQQSPHGGTHRLYRVETEDGRPIAEVLQEAVDAANPNPSWGGRADDSHAAVPIAGDSSLSPRRPAKR